MKNSHRIIKHSCLVFLAIISFLCCFDTAQAWEKIGVFEGTITAIHKTASYYYVATDGSGVYRSADRVSWDQIIVGLQELEIVAITSDPNDDNYLYCASASVLYSSSDQGSSWSVFTIANPLTPQPRYTSLTYASYNSIPFLFVGTYGARLGRITLSSHVWVTISTFPKRILALSAYEHRVFAGTEYDSTSQADNPGGIWKYDLSVGTSNNENGSGISWPSIAVHYYIANLSPPLVYRIVLLAGSDGHGVASGVETAIEIMYSAYCPPTPPDVPPDGRFQAIDFYISLVFFEALAGTENSLYCLSEDPRSTGCSDGYSDTGFVGNIRAVGVGNYYAGLFGTRGKGLFTAGDGNSSTICTVREPVPPSEIPHRNVNQIAVSPNFATDDTIFIASRSEGIYKSIGPGPSGVIREFTRTFCNPNAYGPVDILSLDLIPAYDDLGSAWSSNYTNDKVLIAGSNGYGIFLSNDGGASWSSGNAGSMPPNAVITDVEYSPNARTDRVAYAASWNRGLFYSANGGQSWSLISCSTTLHISDISIPPNYNHTTNRTVWGATAEGIYRFTYQTGPGWTCTQHSAGPQAIPATRLKTAVIAPTTYVFFATPVNGVILGKWNGSQWIEVQLADGDGDVPATAKVKDIDISSWFTDASSYCDLFVIVYKSSGDNVYRGRYRPSPESFVGWNDINAPSTWEKRFTAITLGPDYAPAGGGPLYLGHPFMGLLSQASSVANWMPASGYYAYPHEVTATAVDPDFPNLVLSGTPDMGMFISYDGGDSACPAGRLLDWNTGSEFQSVTSVKTIAIAPGETSVILDAPFTTDPTLSGGWSVDDGGSDNYSWFWQNGSGGYGIPPTPCNTAVFGMPYSYMQVDSSCAGKYTMNEGLVSPIIDCSQHITVILEFDHYFRRLSGTERAAVYVRNMGSGWSLVETWTLTTANPTHERIELPADVVPGKDEVQIKFVYENAYNDYYWFIDNVLVWGLLDTTPQRNVVIGTEAHGIYYASYETPSDARAISWTPATSLDTANQISTADVSKVAFYGPGEDLRASVENNPSAATAAPSFVSDDLGATWSAVFGGLSDGTLMTDIAFDATAKKRIPLYESPLMRIANSGKAQTLTMWGCSAGSNSVPYKSSDAFFSGGAKSGTAGAYRYDNNADTWSLRNGSGDYSLSVNLYYSMILSTTDDLVFIGGWSDDGLNSIYSGLWRSDDDGLTWFLVNAGLDTLNAKQITSMLETDDGNLLIGVNDPTDGGVFMSDANGYAWVRIDDFTGARGVNALTRSKTIPAIYYASMVSDGSQRSLDLTSVTVDPVPEFLANTDPSTLADAIYSDNADYEKWFQGTTAAAVSFASVSAGVDLSTTYQWDFESDGSWDASGSTTSNTYATGGIKTVSLRLNADDSLIRTHKIFIRDTTPPPVPDGTDTGSAMTVSKNATDGTSIHVTWDDQCDPFSTNIVYGSLTDLDSYAPSGSECGVEPDHDWIIGSQTDIWFVIVSNDGYETEGSWGHNSDGVERSDSVASCVMSSSCPCCSKEDSGTCD